LTADYRKLLEKILLKKARGYSFKEKVEEYAVVDGEKTLVKTKVTTKKSPPDVMAVKSLLELGQEEKSVSEMTDEQLQVEKLRLIRLLKVCDENADPRIGGDSD